MFEKRVSQSERRIRNSQVTSMHTVLEHHSVPIPIAKCIYSPWNRPYKAHDNRSELRKIRQRADSAMPRNPAKDPSFGRAHVRVWEFLGCFLFAGEGNTMAWAPLFAHAWDFP